MFKQITIQLTEPICHCDEQDLGWTVFQSPAGPALKVWCRGCEVSLVIPTKEFRANFLFEKSYPGRKAPVVKQEKGDIVDFVAYMKRKESGDLPS